MFGELWLLLFVFLLVLGLGFQEGVIATVGSLGLITLGLSWLWSRFSLERLSYQRSISQSRVFTGEEITLSIALTNRKPVPLPWVRIEDDFPESLELIGVELEASSAPRTRNLVHSTSVAWYERVKWSYRLRCPTRGIYRLGPARISSGDLFGLFPSSREETEQEYLLVYPKPVNLLEIDVIPRRPFGDYRGGERLYTDNARQAGIKDYEPGDPANSIDWKSTARRRSLQVKVFEPSRSLVVGLFLNLDTVGVTWGGHIPIYEERSVTLAASIAQDGFDKGYLVGLYTNGLSVVYERPMNVPPSRNPRQLNLIYEALAMVSGFVAHPLEDTLMRYARHLPQGATLVLITAVLPRGLAEALEFLVKKGRKLTVAWVGDEPPLGLPEGVNLQLLGPYLASLEQQNGSTG